MPQANAISMALTSSALHHVGMHAGGSSLILNID